MMAPQSEMLQKNPCNFWIFLEFFGFFGGCTRIFLSEQPLAANRFITPSYGHKLVELLTRKKHTVVTHITLAVVEERRMITRY